MNRPVVALTTVAAKRPVAARLPVAVVLLLPLLLAGSSAAAAPVTPAPSLPAKVEQAVRSLRGVMGVAAKDLRTGESVFVNAATPFPTASVIKVAVVFLIGHLLEGNVLSPKLVGDRVGLHPVWIMFALLAGGSLFGFVGVLVAVPVAAVGGVIVRHLLARYRESALYRGENAA